MQCPQIVVLALCLILALTLAGCEREPVFQGRGLGHWYSVVQRSHDVDELVRAGEALSEAGPLAEPAAWELVRVLSDRQEFGHYRGLGAGDVDRVFVSFRKALHGIGPAAGAQIIKALELGRTVSPDVYAAISADSVPVLVRAMEHRHPAVRLGLVQAMGEIGPRAGTAAPALVAALGAEDEQVRQAAARSLGLIDADASLAVPALLKVRRDASLWMRQAVVFSLGRFPSRAEEVIPVLIEATGDGDPLVRMEAAQSMWRYPQAVSRCADATARLLHDAEAGVRAAALRLLTENKGFDGVSTGELAKLLARVEPEVTEAALAAIERRGAAAADGMPALMELVRAHRGDIQQPLRVKAMAAIGEPAVPTLVTMLRYQEPPATPTSPDRAWQVRLEAARALAAMDPLAAAGALDALNTVAGDARENALAREAARAAVQRIIKASTKN